MPLTAFDLDGTLVDQSSAARLWTEEFVEQRNLPTEATDLIAAGWRIGIASNGMADNQEGKIRSTGLAELVDGWIISGEAGIRKPDPQILEVLAQRLGCALEGWMVGDSLEHDVMGGLAAGLRTAWIAPPYASVPVGSARFDIHRSTVAEAVETILAG